MGRVMQPETTTWQFSDGINVHCRVWDRPNPEKEVWFVHGLGDHGGRYLELGKMLFDQGFRVVIADQRGNGLSGGKRGHAAHFENLTDELKLTIEKTGLSGTKKYLIGQSMGGLIVTRFIQKFPSMVNAAVLLSPMFRTTNPPPKMKLLLARILKSVWPSLTLKAGLKLKDLTKSEKKQAEYRADRLKNQMISTVFAVTFLESAEKALADAKTVTTPMLAMHGSADQITSPIATAEFSEKSQSIDLKIWEGKLHELFHDADNEAVIETMFEWLRDH